VSASRELWSSPVTNLWQYAVIVGAEPTCSDQGSLPWLGRLAIRTVRRPSFVRMHISRSAATHVAHASEVRVNRTLYIIRSRRLTTISTVYLMQPACCLQR
jgi:hypothetical protein